MPLEKILIKKAVVPDEQKVIKANIMLLIPIRNNPDIRITVRPMFCINFDRNNDKNNDETGVALKINPIRDSETPWSIATFEKKGEITVKAMQTINTAKYIPPFLIKVAIYEHFIHFN